MFLVTRTHTTLPYLTVNYTHLYYRIHRFYPTLKQLDASVAPLPLCSISALLTHLPHLEILFLSHIRENPPVTNYIKTVLQNLRVLQLVFSMSHSWFIN
jgi:hypothetical protein